MKKEQSLQEIINNYRNAPNGDFWQVTSSKLRMVRDQAILSLVERLQFGNVLDFACGLGVIASQLARQANYVLGIDGAPPAIEKAKELSASLDNIEFQVGSLENVHQQLKAKRFDLLTITDAFCYFSRDEQLCLLNRASITGVKYCLLEIRAADRKGTKDLRYAEGNDFVRVSDITDFIDKTDYKIIKYNFSRVYGSHDIMNREAYALIIRFISKLIKRWLIDAPTAIIFTPVRFSGDEVYDPLVLKQRLKWCTFWYRIPGLRKFIEPVISGIALLAKKEK